MVRKHSPRRSPQSCPSGDFSPFSAEMFQNDFSSICTVENCVFREIEKHALDHFSDLLESAVYLKICFICKVFQDAVWDEKVVRKHSPGRSPQSCPSGDFSTFSAEMVQMIFRRFAQSRIAFSEKLRNMPSIIFSDLLESALNLEICSIHKVFRERCLRKKNVQKVYVLREQREIKF